MLTSNRSPGAARSKALPPSENPGKSQKSQVNPLKQAGRTMRFKFVKPLFASKSRPIASGELFKPAG